VELSVVVARNSRFAVAAKRLSVSRASACETIAEVVESPEPLIVLPWIAPRATTWDARSLFDDIILDREEAT